MARRNRIRQGPLVIVMLVILAIWLIWQGGDNASLFSPAGLLLLLSLLLALNMLLRRKVRPQKKDTTVASPYNRSSARHHLERGKAVTRSRTERTSKPETWPYDGSYCVHCGLKRHDEEDICRRCRQPINHPA